MSDGGLFDGVLLRALQAALTDVAAAMTGIPDVTPTVGEQLAAMTVIRVGADRALRSLVTEARYEGVSWAEIARALNVARQSAHERYSDVEEHWFWLG